MKPLLVVNPASNGGKTGPGWAELYRPIARALGPCEVAFTERAGHATQLAREGAHAGYDRIVAVGGDGTFSEVASGVLASERPSAVGVIHQGTGGDFRRSLGIEHRLDHYLRALNTDSPRLIDAGRVVYSGRNGETESRYFVNIASVGMGGLVDKYVGEGSRLFGGSAAYLSASVKALALGAAGRLTCQLTLAGETQTIRLQTRILAICNGRYFGGGMEVAPMARLDDGVFEVVAFGGEHRLPMLEVMSAVRSGSHLSRRGVVHHRVTSIELQLENADVADRFLLDVDGEYAGGLPGKFQVLPKAFRVLA